MLLRWPWPSDVSALRAWSRSHRCDCSACFSHP
uniref:Uncharacterized protein n=1 Tax=Arundo donax TaxID=35708 RepID=A0A0A9B7W2_ARUDO